MAQAAYVGSWLFKSRDLPVWSGAGRGTNWFDGGSHFYETYETKDGRFVAVGALEPQFYAQVGRSVPSSTSWTGPTFRNDD